MVILQIVPEMNSGGVETGTLDLAKELARQGHRAIVISAGGALVSALEQAGVRHYTLAVHKKSLYSMLRMIPAVRRIIRQEQVDIVHARSRVPAWIAWGACRGTRASFITTCHGRYSPHAFSRIMARGERVIVISTAMQQHAVQRLGADPDRVRLIYRGVDTERFRFRGFYTASGPHPPRIGIVGRLTALKGHRVLLAAFGTVLARYPQARLLIAGDAPRKKTEYAAELQEYARTVGIGTQVDFLGTVADVPRFMSGLDVLVLATTAEEGFGRVIIEAGAVGVPVVATAVGGVTEIITHQEHGLLAAPSNPTQLAEAICRLLSDPERAAGYAAALRRRVQAEFSLEALVRKTVAVYEEADSEKKLLVCKLGALGDVVLIGPSLRALRRAFPRWHIAVLVLERFAPVLRNCPYIDEIIPVRTRRWSELIRVGGSLRRRHFSCSIDFQNNRFTHAICRYAAIPQRIGYANGKWAGLLNQAVAVPAAPLSPVAHQFVLLHAAGIPAEDQQLEYWLNDRQLRQARELLRQQGAVDCGLIGISPFASPRWQTKNLTRPQLESLIRLLAEQFPQQQILFTGMREQRQDIEQLCRLIPGRAVNGAGCTELDNLAAVISCCEVFISPDSAALHLAIAAGIPVVALFGPTDPQRHLPFSSKCVLIRSETECMPCYKAQCSRRTCMSQIDVRKIVDAVRALLPA